MAHLRESNSYLTWISSILRSGEKMARLEWTADDRVVLAEVTDREKFAERELFDVPAGSITRANSTLQWLRLYLPDGRNFQVDLNSAMPVAFAAPMSPNDMVAYIEAHPQAAPADWVEALRAVGVDVKVTGPGRFFGLVALATVVLVAVIAVVVLVVN